MRHNTKNEFVHASALNLPYADSSVEQVLCIEVLEHFDDAGKVVSEISRVLKPNGLAVIATPDNSKLLWKVVQFFYNRVGEYRGKHSTLFTPTTLMKTAKDYGLGLIQLEYVAKCDMVALFRKTVADTRT